MFQGAGQVGQQFTKANLDDLTFFPFPEITRRTRSTAAIDAPIDGFMMCKSPKDKDARSQVPRVPRDRRGREDLPRLRPDRRRHRDRLRREQLQPAAEGLGEDHLWHEEHRPVPRPRHPAGLRLPDRSRTPCRRSSTTRTAARPAAAWRPRRRRSSPDRPRPPSAHRPTRRRVDSGDEHAPASPPSGVAPPAHAAGQVVLALMVGVPLAARPVFIWGPAIATVFLSFTNATGAAPIKSIGSQNYHFMTQIDPAFWPAVRHNIIWLLVFLVIATPFGMLLRRAPRPGHPRQPDLPEHLLPAGDAVAGAIGIIWQIVYTPRAGCSTALLGAASSNGASTSSATPASTSGRCSSRQPGGRRATSWCSTWPVCKAVDPGIARGGGARRRERLADVLARGVPGDAPDQHRRYSSSRSSSRCAPSTWSTSPTEASTGWSCSRR